MHRSQSPAPRPLPIPGTPPSHPGANPERNWEPQCRSRNNKLKSGSLRMCNKAGSLGRETFNFQKLHTSHPHTVPHARREPQGHMAFWAALGLLSRKTPRLAHITVQESPKMHSCRSLSLCKSSICHATFSLTCMTEPGEALKRVGPGWRDQCQPALSVPCPQHLQLIHREPQLLIRARQRGTSTHPCRPHLPCRAGLCLWLQTGCRKWGTREGWGCHRALETLQGAPSPEATGYSPTERQPRWKGT